MKKIVALLTLTILCTGTFAPLGALPGPEPEITPITTAEAAAIRGSGCSVYYAGITATLLALADAFGGLGLMILAAYAPMFAVIECGS